MCIAVSKGSWDSFEEAGKGFGETYKFRYYPVELITFLLMKNESEKFENFPQFINSDHFPIMARLSLEWSQICFIWYKVF
jgi:hypothetical protein